MNARQCPVEGCWVYVQRTVKGTLEDGMAAHLAMLHPDAPETTAALVARDQAQDPQE